MRWFVSLVLVLAGFVVTCGGNIAGKTSMGEPCAPKVQSDPNFQFDIGKVYFESESPSCPSQTCLVNHFQGRVGEPYGGKTIQPQCSTRREADAVYCSCRCANAFGKTDDGDVYCPCASGFVCTPLVLGIGAKNDGSGSYCIKAGTAYASAGCDAPCDPMSQPCP